MNTIDLHLIKKTLGPGVETLKTQGGTEILKNTGWHRNTTNTRWHRNTKKHRVAQKN